MTSDHRPDLPPAESRTGCEMCSFTDGGCSFCSGRTAIQTANARADTAGVPVVDLTQHAEFMAARADTTTPEETPDP